MGLFKKYILLGLAARALAGCASEPDLENTPGTCKISCSKPKLASSSMRVRILGEKVDYNCSAKEATALTPVPIRFVIEKPRVNLPADISSGDPTLGGTAAQKVENSNDQWVPVSNVSFQPLVYAGILDSTTEDTGAFDPSDGVLNDVDTWCTDSCGVGSIDIRPMCIPDTTNQIVLGILSGNIDETLQINITEAKDQ